MAAGTVPLIIGGASILAQTGGGLYWTVGGIIFAIAGAVGNAWVLMVVGSAGGAHAARHSRLALVSSRRHLAPCVRFSLTRRTDIRHLVAFATP
jgi:uncharacterized membrane protein YdjX (TVP38/TMEM64 family)